MYNSANVAEKIKEVAKEKGVSVKKLLEDVGLGFNTMANMKKSMPKADNLARIADYLGCSVDYLLGRETAAAQSAANTAGSAAILQRNDEKLDCLLHCWDDMNDEGHEKVCDYAEDLCQNLKYKKLSSPDLGAEVEQLVG